MGTKNNPGKFDCYANADPDEPMFVLLARDRHAPTLVWLWSVLRELDGEKPDVTGEARECTAAMIQWAADHGRRPTGVAQAVLAGVCELIRAANYAVKSATNTPTDVDAFRLFLCATKFDADEPSGSPGQAKPGE